MLSHTPSLHGTWRNCETPVLTCNGPVADCARRITACERICPRHFRHPALLQGRRTWYLEEKATRVARAGAPWSAAVSAWPFDWI